MKQVYCISGLGADERIFSRLDVPDADLIYLRWLNPEKNESMESYAGRMCQQVGAVEQPIFMGVSFGGMVAVEMAKYYPDARVVLISSVKSRKELPAWMKWVSALGLYVLVPPRPIPLWLRNIGGNILGAESEEELRLVKEFKAKVSPVYLSWAVKQVVSWKNSWQPPRLIHIHGTKDKTFPAKRIEATHFVTGGGHFMIMNRAKELSAILRENLQKQ
jgi:pimeloyl-ACP methyl ester carboxylesterase